MNKITTPKARNTLCTSEILAVTLANYLRSVPGLNCLAVILLSWMALESVHYSFLRGCWSESRDLDCYREPLA
jgi:hypothetical protein